MAMLVVLSALWAVQDPPVCERCGRPLGASAIRWEGTPSEAAKRAKAEEKLVFVVHSSGGAIDPRGAFTNVELGNYLGKHCVASFQRIPTAGSKGALVSYFCAPDGRVLHAVAGAVDAAALLAEAKWVVEASKKAIEESRQTEVPFKALFRRAHAERLRSVYGLVVEPVTFDAPDPSQDEALSWRDPSGRPAVPPLVPPPLDGPDVGFHPAVQEEARGIPDRHGRCWPMSAQARIHQLLSAHALVRIERLYATVLENLMGLRIEDRPGKPVPPRDPDRRKFCPDCQGG